MFEILWYETLELSKKMKNDPKVICISKPAIATTEPEGVSPTQG